MNKKQHSDHINRIMNNPEQVQKIIQGAINDALLIHKKLGNPVCGFKDGKIYWVQPEDIFIRESRQDLDK